MTRGAKTRTHNVSESPGVSHSSNPRDAAVVRSHGPIAPLGGIDRSVADPSATGSQRSIYPERLRDAYRAASVRVILGFLGLVSFPAFVPGMAADWPLLAGYVFVALIFQVLIRQGIGGSSRVLVGGIIDLFMLTYIVHRLGSASTAMIGVYPLTAVLNTLVASPWVSRLLAACGVLAYGGLVMAEALGFLPYAPAYPDLAAFHMDVGQATYSASIMAFIMVLAALVCERLMRTLHLRAAQLSEANQRLEELSQRDPLTQLHNRRYFVQRLEEELLRVKRGHPMALLMLDLDKFKHINDQQGHLVGDEMLRRIAQVINESTRSVDVTGRFGGDEFVVILTDSRAEDAEIVARRLVERVRSIGEEFDPDLPVTVSIGVATARPEDDHDILLNTADEAAYRAKQAGGDRFLCQDPKLNSSRFDSGPREVAG
jgi:diguanylate cyclase (GGDEF)-like protein